MRAMQAKVDSDTYGVSHALNINIDRAAKAADEIQAASQGSAGGEQSEVRSEEEKHAIGHARFKVASATDNNPDCCFDYQLVKDLLRVIDRESSPVAQASWHPVDTYPNDNSVVLVANPDEGRLPVIAWKVEDKWFKYELTERQPLDPQPTIWTEWPKMPKASTVPSAHRGGET